MKKAYKIIIIAFLSLFLVFNYAKAAVDYSEDFNVDLSRWTVIDLTSQQGPSKWFIINGQLHQTSNIGNGKKYTLKDHRGTILLFNEFSGVNFDLKVDFKSNDNDAVGFIFGYQNVDNFYQFTLSHEVKRSIISRLVNGRSEVVAETADSYIKKEWQTLRALSEGGKVAIYLDDSLINQINFNQSGKVGIAIWANKDIYFDNFSIGGTAADSTNVAGSGNDIIVAGVEYEEGDSGSYSYLQQTSFVAKTSNSPEIYLIANNRRHQILNKEVFFDYGFKWNEIKTITNKKLQMYPYAKVVRTADSSRIYYINERLKRKKPVLSQEIFLVYDNKWDDVIIISQKDLQSHSDIRVITSDSTPTIYELKSGIKKAITNIEEFENAGYQWADVVVVKDIELDAYSTRTMFGGEEVIVAGAEYEEGGTGYDFDSQASSSNSYLSVKTIKKNEEIAIPGGSIASVLQLTFTAGLSSPVNVSAIKVTRAKGISAIDEILITDTDNNVLGQNTFSSSSNQLEIRLNPNLYIAPNTNRTINIKASAKRQEHVAYDQLSIKLEQDIITTANVEGSWPIIGDKFKVIPANNLIGQLEVTAVDVSSGLRSVYVGATDQLISKFIFTETTGNEDIYLKRLNITHVGSSYAAMANIDLVDQSNKVIATVAKPNGRDIVFDLEQVPYKIPKNSNKTLSVRADIVGGLGGMIKFVIEKNSDIWAAGGTYIFDLMATSSDSFPLGRGTGSYSNMVKINDANTVVYKNDSSPVGDLVAGSGNQLLGVFDIRVDGIALEYRAVNLQIINGGSVNLEGDLIIRNHKTKKILGKMVADLVSGQSRLFPLNKPVVIPAGQTYTFDVVGNIDNEATTLDTYQIKIIGLDFQVPGVGSAYHFDYEAYGNTLGVKRTGLAITSDSGVSDKEVAAGKTNILIGSFILQAGIAEDLAIDAFNVQEVADYTILNYSDGYSNLKIKVNGKEQVKYSAPNAGPFTASQTFTIKAGKTASVKVYVDTTPLVDNDQVSLSINSVNAYGKSSKLIPGQTGDGTQSFITTFKQSRLVVAKNSNMEDATITAGGGNQKVASFSFANSGVEDIKIKNFTLEETDGSSEISYNNGYSNFKATKGGTVTQPLAGGNEFGGFTVKVGATQLIDIYITPNDSTAGDEFNLILKDIQLDGDVEVQGGSVVGQNISVAPKE